ncbi:molybdopterin-synthase adenylyltransferase MoeB [Tepidamorphus sp. 3E244]|uniref:molybdopterin-synthase adenylyltransferase MoeB n=1 Tax=Tepidamorphus sp. 3E244 TaxID=3385498 RepID=UPI0038FCB885
MALSDTELERFARHIVLPEIGGHGQARLRQARVLVIGAGGLGAPALLYLAAAGIGTLGIVDDDTVALSNLQRQVIHDTASVGTAKTKSAADRIAALDPGVTVETHELRITPDNADELIGGYDLVLDGSDNFATRYCVSDASFRTARRLVTGAVGRFDGSLTVIAAHETAADGTPNPTYRCLFPEAPPDGTVPTCAEAGIIGALTGVIGSLMAMEAIKVVTGAGEPLIGRVLLYDSLAARFDTIGYKWNPANPLNGQQAAE